MSNNGMKLTPINEPEKKPLYKKWWFWAIVVSIAIIFVFVYNFIRVDNIESEILKGNYSTAESLIDDYQKSNPSLVEPYKLYAKLYLAQNQPQKAIEKLANGISNVSSSSKDDLQNEIDEIKAKYQISDSNVNELTNSSTKESDIFDTTTVAEDPKVIEENFKNSCETIDYKTLARNPDKYKGNKYKLTGEVIQVQESSWSDTVDLRINITKEESEYSDNVYWSDTIYATVEIPDGEDRILEDDIITFWGVCDGMYTYESVLGSSVSLPKIDIEYYALGEQ